MFCDSIRGSPPKVLKILTSNIKLFAMFIFPSIQVSEWEFEELDSRDRFQDTDLGDCGFHMINFILAVLNDCRIVNDKLTFSILKRKYAEILNCVEVL